MQIPLPPNDRPPHPGLETESPFPHSLGAIPLVSTEHPDIPAAPGLGDGPHGTAGPPGAPFRSRPFCWKAFPPLPLPVSGSFACVCRAAAPCAGSTGPRTDLRVAESTGALRSLSRVCMPARLPLAGSLSNWWLVTMTMVLTVQIPKGKGFGKRTRLNCSRKRGAWVEIARGAAGTALIQGMDLRRPRGRRGRVRAVIGGGRGRAGCYGLESRQLTFRSSRNPRGPGWARNRGEQCVSGPAQDGSLGAGLGVGLLLRGSLFL